MIKPYLDRTTSEDRARFFRFCAKIIPGYDRERGEQLADAAVRYYRGNAEVRKILAPLHRLERRWYASLSLPDGPDYSVYDDETFLSDLWACWLVYSRKYLLAIRSPKSLSHGGMRSSMEGVRHVVDLGCGFGYTTAVLKETFPEAAVTGTNVVGSRQYEVAARVGRDAGFRLVPTPEAAGPADLVFASEYFEHFESPIHHLREVYAACRPRYLILANSFGSKAIGHFDLYKERGGTIPGKMVGRVFNAELRRLGYHQMKTRCWNNRPAFWERGTGRK